MKTIIHSSFQSLPGSLLAGLLLLSVSACGELNVRDNLIEYGPDERNPPQEMAEINEAEQQLKQQLDSADALLDAGEYAQAELAYRDVLKTFEHNLRAQEGVRRVNSYRQHQVWLDEARRLITQSPENHDSARDLLTRILSENPYNMEASQLYQQIMLAEEQRRLESLRIKLDYDAPVTLEFRETEFKIIIEALAKGTGINFTLDNEVPSTLRASIFIKNMPIEDALDMLVQSNNLRMKVLSVDSVVIYPDKAAKIRQYQDLIIRSFYLEYADPPAIAGLLRSMLGIKQIETDERLPMIMIKDVPEVMPLAEKLIAAYDLPEPEVMLEMEIIEVSRSFGQDTGVRWPTQLSVLSGQGALTLEQLRNTDSSTIGVSPNPALLFDGQDSQISLLANPRVRVKNGESARIHIGDRLPIITSNVASTGVISENVQYIDVGLKLDAEPIINLGGDVDIKLNLDVSSIGNSRTTNSGSLVYEIGTRSTSTHLRLQDGETQVLAGLINDSDRKNISKIPSIGDLPGLGRLFSTHSDTKVKTELVLMITPRIVRQSRAPQAHLSRYWVGSELQAGRSFTQPISREDASRLFRPGQAPVAPRSQPEAESEYQDQTPEGLNIQLPPGMTSDF